MKPSAFACVSLALAMALAPAPATPLAAQQPSTVHIALDGAGKRVAVSPTLYGIFLEEINHAGEGGLYAEMVQNRDFEANTLPAGARWAGNLVRTLDDWQERKGFGNELWGWRLEEKGGAVAQIRQSAEHPLTLENPHSLRLVAKATGTGLALLNDGFWGMHFIAGETYHLSFYARTAPGQTLRLKAALESASGHETYADSTVTIAGDWKQYHVDLRASTSDVNGRLAIGMLDTGTAWFDVVSLFPAKTFHDRPNGLRADMVQVLDDLHPAFMRFPGGAVTGGLNLDDRFQWKHSIGDIAHRKGMFDLWGYYSTNGLGFHEYLQLIEDLGGTALYVCNPGFSDNYRHAEYAKPAQLKDFVQEAMDALEYALGPADSPWGAKRAANGHPQPFRLQYIEIGNETGGSVYPGNYKLFYTAIKAKYPLLTIIAADQIPAGPDAAVKVEMVDQHEFGASAKLYQDWTMYDAVPRTGPKYYVGEYSVDRGSGEGDLESALAEAAFMMGLERNSDLVRISSYAPLFAHVMDNAWPVNMIHFDSSRVAPRTSYFIQKLFAGNRPDETLETTIDPVPQAFSGPVYALGGWDAHHGEIIVKVINRSETAQPIELTLRGLPPARGPVTVTELADPDSQAENTVDEPARVVPKTKALTLQGDRLLYTLAANSLTVLRIDSNTSKR